MSAGGPTLAVVGATGAVGSVIREVLPRWRDVWGEVRLSAAAEDVGAVCRVGTSQLPIEELTPEFFKGVDVALMDIPPHITAHWAQVATEQGTVVIDNSPTYRRDPQVPLVVPEINPSAVSERAKGIIAGPGGTVMTFIDVLAVLHARWELTELVVTGFQAASGLGRAGMTRLHDELAVVGGQRHLGMKPGDVRRVIEHELGESVFPGPLAMNVLPFAGRHVGEGWSSEESKVRQETRKILGMPDLRVSATIVRVPVVSTHSVSVHATFARNLNVLRARKALIEAPSVVVIDDPDTLDFPTPVDIVGADPRFVGRMRQAIDFPRTLDLFVCGDNLRKGAALNMVQTAELVARTL